MNTASKVEMAMVIVLAVSCCLVSMMPQDAEGTDSPVTLENGASLTETIQSIQAGDNLTIVLQEGCTYTLTGVGFAGNSLTIQGNNATVSVIDTPHNNNGQTTYQSAWITSSARGTVDISNVNFVVDQNVNTDSYTSCILYFAYFTDATVSDCTFQKVQLALTTATDYPAMDATVSDLIMTIPEGDTAYSGQYALLLTNLDDVKVSGCRIIGYDRGLNIGIIGDDPTASVTGCTFQNIQGKCAIQFGGTVGNGNVSFSGCNFNNCAVAASIHESAEGTDGSILSVGNSYSRIGTLLLYSVANNATSDVKFTSSSDNMESVTEQVATENAAVEAPEDGITETESTWYSDDLTIKTENDLLEFAQMVNSGNDFSEKTVKLGADITITQSDWTPIGQGVRLSPQSSTDPIYSNDSTPFRGVFNGQGNKIINLTITTTSAEEAPLGLFGIVERGTVQNIVFENVKIDVSGCNLAGSVAGMLCGGGTISGCTVESGSINVAEGGGSIVGKVIKDGTISVCTNEGATITCASGNAGGIVGGSYYKPETITGLVVLDCTNEGDVTVVNGGYAGGIVGLSSANITNCTNNGDVKAVGTCIGGIAGTQKNAGTITGCTNNGSITNGTEDQTTSNYGTGGIVGWVCYLGDGFFTASGTSQIVITDCHNNANVWSNGTGVGGIVGMAYHGVTIQECDSGTDSQYGTVTITGNNMIGGILGGLQITDGNHIAEGCHTRIIGNVCAGTVDDLGASRNMAKLGGHIPYSSSHNCTLIHGSLVTILDNDTSGMTGDLPDTTGGGETVAYIEFDDEMYGYPTLTAAIAAAEENSTIVLVQDVSETVSILAEKIITLDLNGCTLSSNGTTITNSGTLTITDSSDDESGSITASAGVNAQPVIRSTGTLTLEKGKVTRDSTGVTAGQNAGYVIYSEGTLNINGGTVSAATYNSSLINSKGTSADSPATNNISGGTIVQQNGNIAVKNDDYSTLNVTGGIISATYDYQDNVGQAIQNWSTATLSDGELYGAVTTWSYDDIPNGHTLEITDDVIINGMVLASKNAADDNAIPQVTITGGTITGSLQTRAAGSDVPDAEWIQVSGGTFNYDIDDRFRAPGYVMVDNGDGTYTASYDPTQSVARIGKVYYPTLQAALDAARDGDTIQILGDIVLTGDSNTPGAIISSGVIIDGTNPEGGVFTISSSTARKVLTTVEDASFGATLTLQNLRVENTYSGGRCLDTRGLSSGLVLDNVTLSAPNGSKSQPLTIGGNCSSTLKIEIKNSVIQSSATGYDITIFNPVDLTITDSELTGWAAVYLKNPDKSEGSHGSSVSISDSTITSVNSIEYEGGQNDFAAIVLEDNGITVEMTNVIVIIEETAGNEQKLFLSNPQSGASTGTNLFRIGGENTRVTFIGENTKFAADDSNAAIFEVTGGTYNIDIWDYLAPGYMLDENGAVQEAPEYMSGFGVDPTDVLQGDSVTVTVIDNADEHSDLTYKLTLNGTVIDTGKTINFVPEAEEYVLEISGTHYGVSVNEEYPIYITIVPPVMLTFHYPDGSTQEIKVAEGEPVTIDGPDEVPEQFGYEFAEWRTGSGESLRGYIPTEDTDLYPGWDLVDPTVSVSVSGDLYRDGVVIVTVTATHVLDDQGVRYTYLMGNKDTGRVTEQAGNVFYIRSEGTYLFGADAILGDSTGRGTYEGYVEVELNVPVIPDDDDDYVPPTPPDIIVNYDDSGDDTAVGTAACAAAAVAAAIIACLIIMERRRN